MPPSAIVLAAGLSRRMGRPKLLLPWGKHTVIRQVTATLVASGLEDIVVVTGHQAEEVETALHGLPVRTVFNPGYATGEMIESVRIGLEALDTTFVKGLPQPEAALICLGHQPQMEEATVRAVLAAGSGAGWQAIVIPSYRMRRGHPVLLPRAVWPDATIAGVTLRDVLDRHGALIRYVSVDSATVLADIDTPEEYLRAGSGSEEGEGG